MTSQLQEKFMAKNGNVFYLFAVLWSWWRGRHWSFAPLLMWRLCLGNSRCSGGGSIPPLGRVVRAQGNRSGGRSIRWFFSWVVLRWPAGPVIILIATTDRRKFAAWSLFWGTRRRRLSRRHLLGSLVAWNSWWTVVRRPFGLFVRWIEGLFDDPTSGYGRLPGWARLGTAFCRRRNLGRWRVAADHWRRRWYRSGASFGLCRCSACFWRWRRLLCSGRWRHWANFDITFFFGCFSGKTVDRVFMLTRRRVSRGGG